MVEFKVGEMESGKKIQRLVRQMLPGVPLSGIHKMVRTGRVKLNGKRAKADDIVAVGDIIRLFMAEADYEQVSKKEKKFVGIDFRVDIVYEDEHIVVVNKPVGLLTHGANGEFKKTLVNEVLAYLHHKGELKSSVFTPAPVHRLDRNTSGLVVFAKNGEAIRKLNAEIKDHKIEKWYLAIVKGVISKEGEIDIRLERSDNSRTMVREGGKESVTKYHPLVSRNGTTIVLVQLISGRTHQIRAHFSHIGHPLLGDVKYGGGRPLKDSHEIHQWLHAAKIRLPDEREFSAPVPPNFIHQLYEIGYTSAEIKQVEDSVR